MLAPTQVKQTDAAAGTALARQLLGRVGLAEKFDAWPDQRYGDPQTAESRQVLSALH